MKTAIMALTRSGVQLAHKLGREMDADIYIHPFSPDFKGTIEKVFKTYDALIFIMASGIVVRSIAPYIQDKTLDPAVVVVDELGRFAISLLSGHIGGANRLAARVALHIGAVPVITTATDIQGVIAFDELAVMNGCAIENIQDLKYISAALVNGGIVGLYCDIPLSGELPENIMTLEAEGKCRFAVVLSNTDRIPVQAEKTLYLRPKNLVVGIGCKKGKSMAEIEKAVVEFLRMNKKSSLSVRMLTSIDLKAGEEGILAFCKRRQLPFKTYTAEEIRMVEKDFPPSEFVKKVTGVGSVAEACAALAARRAKLICRKTVYDGITLALAEEEMVFTL